jgi:hypothetical protein
MYAHLAFRGRQFLATPTLADATSDLGEWPLPLSNIIGELSVGPLMDAIDNDPLSAINVCSEARVARFLLMP